MLNYALLRKHDRELLDTCDNRLLSVFEQAFGRIKATFGSASLEDPECAAAIFRRCVEALQEAEDGDPCGPDSEGGLVLPLSDD